MLKNFFAMTALIWAISISQAKIVDEKGHILTDVTQITSYFQKADPLKNISTLSQLNDYAQQHFLRPKGTERLDEKAIQHYKHLCAQLSETDKEKLFQVFNKLGYVETLYPKNKTPDYICIQGATVPTMRERMMFLAELVETGKITLTKTTKIVALVGERRLFASETPEVLLSSAPWEIDPLWKAPEVLPTDEREAAMFIWAQLKLPKALRDKDVLFVNAPKKQGESRAQTIDSTQTWLKTEQVKGNIMMISSSPYVPYQESVMNYAIKKVKLDKQVKVEGVGSGGAWGKRDIDIDLGIALDTLAREIFMEQQRMDLH